MFHSSEQVLHLRVHFQDISNVKAGLRYSLHAKQKIQDHTLMGKNTKWEHTFPATVAQGAVVHISSFVDLSLKKEKGKWKRAYVLAVSLIEQGVVSGRQVTRQSPFVQYDLCRLFEQCCNNTPQMYMCSFFVDNPQANTVPGAMQLTFTCSMAPADGAGGPSPGGNTAARPTSAPKSPPLQFAPNLPSGAMSSPTHPQQPLQGPPSTPPPRQGHIVASQATPSPEIAGAFSPQQQHNQAMQSLIARLPDVNLNEASEALRNTDGNVDAAFELLVLQQMEKSKRLPPAVTHPTEPELPPTIKNTSSSSSGIPLHPAAADVAPPTADQAVTLPPAMMESRPEVAELKSRLPGVSEEDITQALLNTDHNVDLAYNLLVMQQLEPPAPPPPPARRESSTPPQATGSTTSTSTSSSPPQSLPAPTQDPLASPPVPSPVTESSPTAATDEASQQPSSPPLGAGKFYPYEQLRTHSGKLTNADIDVSNRQNYLSDEDFVSVFKMTKAEFASLKPWRQILKKKEVDLF